MLPEVPGEHNDGLPHPFGPAPHPHVREGCFPNKAFLAQLISLQGTVWTHGYKLRFHALVLR